MKINLNYRLMRKCLILAFLIIGIVFVALNSKFTQSVAAAECCETCEGGGDPMQAESNCNAYYVGCRLVYSQPICQANYDNCIDQANQCYIHCVYCSGGGPGGECNSNGDCNYNEFCGADGYCHYY